MANFNSNEDHYGAANYDKLVCEFLYERYKQVAPAICYHSQQFAEKLLKSVYQSNDLVAARSHDLLRLATKLEEMGLLSFTDEAWRACAFLNQCEASIRYVTFTESQYGEALEALAHANEIAKEVGENGYRTLHIDVPAHFLRDEMCQYRENSRDSSHRETLDEMGDAKTSESEFFEDRGEYGHSQGLER